MLQLFTIIFRETIEISMILSIVFAATKDLKRRNTYIALGCVLGAVGVFCLALFAGKIIDLFDGYGQEIVNAAILIIASIAIIYTILWMKHSAKKTKDHVAESLLSLTLVTAFALFREGAEMLLFSYSVITSSPEATSHLILSGFLGFVVAAMLGVLMYMGIIVFSGKYIFKITSMLLSFVAAGMMIQATNLLVSSQIIEINQEPLWSTAWLVPQHSFIGKLLHSITGYVDNPTALELAVYAFTLLSIYIFSKKKGNRGQRTL